MPEPADNAEAHEAEPVDGEIVPAQALAEVRRLPVTADGSTTQIERRRATVPATVAAATGGFLLGVGAFICLKILRRPSAAGRLGRRRGRLFGKDKGLEVQASRSFLVDVHMLKR